VRSAGIALILAASCTTQVPGSPDHVGAEAVALPDGTRLTLDVGVEIRRDEQDGRVALHGVDGLVVTVQEVGVEDRESGERTPRDVAAALAERVELGEREGELEHHACRAGGVDAECLVGWMVSADGDRVARRGTLVRAGNRIVWIDVIGPEERAVDVDARARRVRESLAIAAGPS
jgi:hypothetical protein